MLSKRVSRLAAAILIALTAVTSSFGLNVPTVNAANGYPDGDAVDCSTQYGIYSWCKAGGPLPYRSNRGYDYRNCTDYVAWKLQSLGISSALTSGRGNGKDWDNNSVGVTVTSVPEVGDAAVFESSNQFGHVAYVEQIRPKAGGGYEARISEYNQPGNGTYREDRWVVASNYVDFNGVGKPLGTPGTQPTPAPAAQIVVRNGNELWGNSNNAGWHLLSNSASADSWKLVGGRLVVKDSSGIYVKDGNGGWARWGDSNFQDFQVSATRVIVRNNNELWSNTGTSGWQMVSNTASAGNWQLVGDRLIVKDSTGIYTRDGISAWTKWGDPNFLDFQATASRIVVRNGANELWSATGPGGWQKYSNTAYAADNWKLVGDRLVVKDSAGVWIRDGAGAWVKYGEPNFLDFQVTPSRIVVRNGANELWSATTPGGWQKYSNTAYAADNWKLVGDRLVVVDGAGIWVRDGAGAWVRWGDSNIQEFQL